MTLFTAVGKCASIVTWSLMYIVIMREPLARTRRLASIVTTVLPSSAYLIIFIFAPVLTFLLALLS
jgi:hypothetical protein